MAFTIPKPEDPNIPSSNRKIVIPKFTTFAPGTLIPILMKDVLPGDRVKVNLRSLIESLPMVCPNLNGYKASFDFYFEPWSNLYGWMTNDTRTGTEDTINRARWTYEFGASVTSGNPKPIQALAVNCVKAGSILDYCGLTPGYFGEVIEGTSGVQPGVHPAEKLLSVLDIYRSYYVNNQEDNGYFLNNYQNINFANGSPVLSFPLKAFDNLFTQLRNAPEAAELSGILDNGDLLDKGPLNLFKTILNASAYSQLGGLPLRTYRMDLNRGILNSDVGNLKSNVKITDDGFSIDTLRFANKLQKLIDRIDLSGGRFSDMMRARWGVKPRGFMNKPDYLGSVSEFFGVTDIVSTASGTNDNIGNNRGNSVLGQQAGFAVKSIERDRHPISFRADQYGTFVCIFSLVPIITYSQGIEREDLKTTFADIYDPAFAQLGYQDVDARELSVFPPVNFLSSDDSTLLYEFDLTSPLVTKASVGKRIAWSEYMSGLPRAHGLFAYGEDFDYWVNNRMYSRYSEATFTDDQVTPIMPLSFLQKFGKTDYTTYIMPDLVNNLFTDTSLTAQNFRLRVTFDMDWRREIGSRIMPHL